MQEKLSSNTPSKALVKVEGPVVHPHPWPRTLRTDDVDEVLVVFSDVEMGAGGPTDDFPQTDYLGELIEAYNAPPFGDKAVTVVFNGDTFDLLKTTYRGAYPTRITADVAVGKLMRVTAAHVAFFERVRRFLRHDRARRRVCFVTGNHDLELLFPETQQLLRSICGSGLVFPGHRYRVGDVRIEHGYQADPMFTVDEAEPFIEHDGERILNLPWGASALLEVAIPLAPVFYALDRVKPRDWVLEQVPEVRDLLLSSFWRYWTRDYWRDYFADTDPMKKISWTMLREVVYRFGTRYADVKMGDHYQSLLDADRDLRLYLIGHQHEPGWWGRNERKVLRTGCFRNEFTVRPDGGYQLLPKVFAEVFLQGDRVVRSHLVEVDAPAPPVGYMPASIQDVRPRARELLESQRLDVPRDRAAQAEQEAKEAQEVASGSADADGFQFMRTLRRALLAED